MGKENVDVETKKDKKYMWANVGIVVLLIISALSTTMLSLVTGQIIDAANNGQFNTFILYIIASAVTIIIGLSANALGYRLIFYNASRKLLTVKDKLLRKDLVKDGWKNVDYSTNLDIIYQNRYVTAFQAVELILVLLLSSVALFAIDWRAVIIGIIAALIPVLSPLLTQGRIRKNASDFADKSQDFQRFTYEHLDIKDEINRYNVEEKVYEMYQQNSKIQERSRFKLQNLLYFADVFSRALGNVSVTVVLFLAGLLVYQKLITVGMMMSILQLTTTLIGPIMQLANLKATYESSRPIFESFQFDQQYEFKEPKKLPDGDLEVKDIHYAYGDGPELFDGFTKTFEKGKKYLIRGESGRGKTTLAGIIAGEIEPDQGKVYFNGTEMNRNNIKNKNIGYQNQTNKIFTGTVFDNIDFYRGYDRDTVESMHDSVHLKPGLDKTVDLNQGLSGGEKTLVAVSRALMEKRDVMIFDEPTTGLNDELSQMITSRILELPSTVIMISHVSDAEFESRFDEVITLD